MCFLFNNNLYWSETGILIFGKEVWIVKHTPSVYWSLCESVHHHYQFWQIDKLQTSLCPNCFATKCTVRGRKFATHFDSEEPPKSFGAQLISETSCHSEILLKETRIHWMRAEIIYRDKNLLPLIVYTIKSAIKSHVWNNETRTGVCNDFLLLRRTFDPLRSRHRRRISSLQVVIILLTSLRPIRATQKWIRDREG